MKIRYLERQSIDSSTFTGSYQALGSATSSPTIIIKVVNNSNSDVDVSIDGSTDHDFIQSKGFALYDIQSNKSLKSSALFQSGTQFYVKGTPASSGLVYLVALTEG